MYSGGRMSFYEMDPAAVFGSGHRVASQTVTATALAGQYLRSLQDTMDRVKHQTVVAAIDRYYLTWQPLVNGVAIDIENLGNHTGASAVAVADADDEALTALSSPAAAVLSVGGDLARPVNDD
jgi:hypothetical protein